MKIKISNFFLAIFLIIPLLGYQPTPVFAACPPDCGSSEEVPKNSGSKTVSLTNPIGSSDVPTLIGKIISAVLGVIGSLALLMVIYGGFTWMLAAGSSEKIKKGRDIIVWAILGLVVIFTSYALVRFVITSI
jgi:hypothetical protein